MADVITRLRVESSEHDQKIKRAADSIKSYAEGCRKAGGTLEQLDEGILESVRDLGKMDTVTRSARGSITEMSKAFVELRMQYNQLTEAEKRSPFGQALKSSLDELKTRVQNSKKELAAIDSELNGSKFGKFGGIIDGIGRKMGVSANLTELLTSRTALLTAGLGAAATAIYKGSEAWVKYNSELAKQDQQTTVVTGLKGFEAKNMTDTMKSVADTYKVDFRQAIEAANTLMSQFGVTGGEAIQLIKDGMQGMILGDGGKLLSMIQQYAPAFRDAGVSASQLVAVIHNSEGGIFTDQNMNAIVMGMKNIRLMTKQTSDALAQIGIDGRRMSQDLNNGTMTVFDALRQVASKLKDVDSNSKTAGEVMQTVFGRQGSMAGTNLAKAIETLNTNLAETKKQTGEVGGAFAELQTATEKLNNAIRDCFEYDGWEQMATGIKAKLVSALAEVVEKLADINAKLQRKTTPSANRSLQQGLDKDVEDVRKASEDEREGIIAKRRRFYQQMENHAWRRAHKNEAKMRSGVYHYKNESGVVVSSAEEARRYQETARTYRALGEEFERRVKEITTPKTTDKTENGTTTTTTTTTTTAKGTSTQQRADEKFRQAEADYQQALEQAALELKAGTADEVQYNRKKLQAEETLWKAIGDARQIYDDPKFAEAQQKAADNVVAMGGEVNRLAEEQKAAQEAARQLKQAQERLSAALNDAVSAFNANDLKGYLSSMSKAGADALQGMGKGSFSYTQSNMAAFRQNLGERLAGAELGSAEFNALNSQLIDATTLANIMQEAIRQGIDIMEFMPQEFWAKIFGENPGDFITPEQWQDVVDKFNEYAKDNPIKLDFETGTVSGVKGGGENSTANMQKLVGSVSTITGALQQLGVEVPEGFQKTLGVMQVITTILMTLESLKTIETGASIMKNIPILGWFFNTGGVVHAADGWGGTVPGNFSHDAVPALLTSGETVLTRAQTGNIASQLEQRNVQESAGGDVRVESDELVLTIRNGAQRRGMTIGEYLGL